MPVTWNPDAVTEAARRGIVRGLTMAGNIVRNEVVRRIQQTPKTGRVYTRRGVEHQASAPGEAPASDTGTLVQSITVEVNAEKLSVTVNAGAAHAPALEFGTDKIEPRPYMRVSLAEKRAELEATIAREIEVEFR
jgi:HK97 gp10 family phage protein